MKQKDKWRADSVIDKKKSKKKKNQRCLSVSTFLEDIISWNFKTIGLVQYLL